MERGMRNAEGDEWQLRIGEEGRLGKWVTITAKMMLWGKKPESSLGTAPHMVLKEFEGIKG